MKTVISSVRILFITMLLGLTSLNQAISQEFKTIFDSNKPIHVSGFGGPIVEFSGVDGKFATSVGGGGAMIVNNLFFGGYGMGLATIHYKDIISYDPITSKFENYSNTQINFGHGGFWIGGILKPTEAIHFAFSAKIGWGGISLMDQMNYQSYYQPTVIDNVFVFTPQAEVELNLIRWFKINFGVGYRLVSGTDLTYNAYTSDLQYIGQQKYFENSEFNSFSGSISLLFGGF